jgi:hypothetical protein
MFHLQLEHSKLTGKEKYDWGAFAELCPGWFNRLGSVEQKIPGIVHGRVGRLKHGT